MISQSQKITEEIGKILWSIFPPEAKTIELLGRFYPTGHQCGPAWFDESGRRLGPKWGDDYSEVERGLAKLALDLQRTPPFDREPFTHMRVELTDKGKMNINFAHIPDWDSWTGLFMRGVSELSEEEARNPALSHTWGVTVEHWQKCRARREQEPYSK